MKVATGPAKGTRDFLPADVRRREHVTRIIREVYEAHGFEPLETPTFERLETLLGKYGEEGDQLVFKVLHRGQQLVDGIRNASEHLGKEGTIVVGRSGETAPSAEKLLSDLGLRYDLTVPLARVYAEYQGKLPAVLKRYQIQPVWRADTPGKGRFREFYQCDVDIVGSPSRLVEAEVAGAVALSLRRLGFDRFKILINHRALLRAMMSAAGVPAALEGPALVAIDKLDKIGAAGVSAELTAKGVTEEAGAALLGLLAEKPSLDRVASFVGDAGADAVRDLRQVLELAGRTPAAEHATFDATLARGLGYYTGAIFEIAVEDLAGSLGGGGRYDNLIGMFLGREVPACGFSIGLERILVVMEQRNMFPGSLAGIDLALAATDEDAIPHVVQLAYDLRAKGLRVDLAPRVEKPGKLRASADERAIPHAAWLSSKDPGVLGFWSRAEPDKRDTTVSVAELSARLAKR